MVTRYGVIPIVRTSRASLISSRLKQGIGFKLRVTDKAVVLQQTKERVFVESGDGHAIWATVGVSAHVIDASWEALRDAVEYMLTIKAPAAG